MNVLDSFKLDGKVALVTGAAGQFGRQIAEALAEAGAKTFVASRGIEKLEEEAERMRQGGRDITAIRLDQADEGSVRNCLDRIVEEAGQVDILVNNAVLRPMTKDAERYEAFKKSLDVNATGVLMMLDIFGQHMAGQGSGSIINIGSIYGLVGPDFSLYEGLDMYTAPDYFFNKGGMINLTRYMAATYGPAGVRVNCIHPGGFFTEKINDVFLERYKKRTFLGRMANDTDIQGIIVLLASDASAYITGANIPVDAGLTAK